MPPGDPETGFSVTMEVPMTTHSDRITNTEDADFDKTMKITGIVIVLIAIVGAAFWYFAG